jgi:hypothetical protein
MTDPAYIRDFKAFTKGPLRLVDLKRLDGELYGENDRALGVLRASLLEATLETYLMSYVRPSFNADFTRRLFEFSGILGLFGAKITIAYAFNWIGPETRHDLELIRQIRNEFAHCRKSLEFTDAPVAAVCHHLKSTDWPGAPPTRIGRSSIAFFAIAR